MKKLLSFFWLLIWLAPQTSVAEPELLQPDEAFAFSARAVDANTLEASWHLADGYYLYRNKFHFSVTGDSVSAGDPQFPAGKIKSDPAFGDVETYVHDVSVKIPLKREAGSGNEIKLTARYQGCNEPVGVCYPPQTKTVALTLPAAKAVSEDSAPTNSLNSLADYLGSGNDQEFLPVDEAFRVLLEARDKKTLVARFSIAEGYYLYRDKMKFSAADGSELGAPAMPEGKEKEDEYLGKTEVYLHNADIVIPLLKVGESVKLNVAYQGCAEAGICYPPVKKTLDISLADAPSAGANVAVATLAPPAVDSAKPASIEKGFWAAILTAFLIGVGLSFTPCVLPMIPILSSMVVGQSNEHTSKLRAGLLSLAYVLGTAATFTIAGVIAGSTGDQLQAYFQNVWAIGAMAIIFVLLALSMFGLYEIQMPSFVQSKLQTTTQGMRSGSFITLFIVGMLSALIVGACVSPPLIAALSVAIAKQDPVLGGAIMFAMAMGMGVVLILVGIGLGSLVPKAGTWMDTVKYVFGVMLIAVAIYMLGTLPQVPVLLLWGVFFIVLGVYLGATQSLPEGASGWRVLFKGLGTALLIWGVLSLFGGVQGNRDPLKPLAGLSFAAGETSGKMPGQVTESLFTRVQDLDDLDRQLAAAKAAEKPVVLDYYATWCTNCVHMEETTFSDPRVRSAVAGHYVMLQADVTDPGSKQTKELKKRYGVFGPPAMLFFSADGNQRKDLSVYGYKTVDEFLAHIAKL